MGEQPGRERIYRCHKGGFLLRSGETQGVIHDVYCRKCERRHDVYLGNPECADRPPERRDDAGSAAGLASRGVRAVG